MSKTTIENNPCPCGSKATYAACCALLHNGAPAADAAALMRSRYTAFALGLDDYIQRSWHPSTRPAASAAKESDNPRWIGLQIKRYQALDSDHATVEFVARYKINGRAFVLHEISNFVRENEHWFYVDGVVN